MTSGEVPPVLSAEDAAVVLGCSAEDLNGWRRKALPSGPRKRSGQRDDQYRPDEIVAVAAGRWLEQLKRRDAAAVVARLVTDPPDDEDWCVLTTYRTVLVITDPASPELARRRKVREAVFHPGGFYDAMRELV